MKQLRRCLHSCVAIALLVGLVNEVMHSSKTTRSIPLSERQKNDAPKNKSLAALAEDDYNQLSSLLEYRNESDAAHAPFSVLTMHRILQQTKSLHVFVYNSSHFPNLTFDHLRKRVMAGRYTWREEWGMRFKDYAKWELRYLTALEESTSTEPFVRVDDPSQADMFVIPIPWGAIFTASISPAQDGRLALDTLYKQEWFQRFPEKHVTMSFIEPLFSRPKARMMKRKLGLTANDYEALQNTVLVKDSDCWLWDSALGQGIPQRGYWPSQREAVNKRGWSFSLMGAASDPKQQLQRPTWTNWSNRTFHFFYHTRQSDSESNSTQFRHRPTEVADQLEQPSSISWDIPQKRWNAEFSDSKFCLVIRGDKPYSRALARSLRNACIPVVISDMLPAFGPMFRSLLRLTDYAVVVSEKDFLQDPAGSLRRATSSLSPEKILRLLDGIRLMQRIIIPDHPDGSLFVPAFLAETLASQTEEYYDLGGHEELMWDYSLID